MIIDNSATGVTSKSSIAGGEALRSAVSLAGDYIVDPDGICPPINLSNCAFGSSFPKNKISAGTGPYLGFWHERSGTGSNILGEVNGSVCDLPQGIRGGWIDQGL